MYPGVHAATHPDKIAVLDVGSDDSITYRLLEDRSVQLARVLHDAGLRRGDVVALLSENSPRTFEVYWAALRSGLYFTPLNHNLAAAEIAYILADSGAGALIVSAGRRELAEALVNDHSTPDYRLAYGGEVEGYDRYEDRVEAADPVPMADQPRGAEMLYSSGTTGRPKGIRPRLADGQITEVPDRLATLLQGRFGMTDETIYLSPAPHYHAAPLKWCASVLGCGGTVAMMQRFDPHQTLAAIQTHRVTHAQFVPTMFVRMLKLPEPDRHRYDLSSLRVAVHAAAPCPVEVKQAMLDWWGPILFEYYGFSEGFGLTTIDSPDWLAHPGSVGQAVMGTIRICDDSGQELPNGEIGTVYFERKRMSFAYLNDPAKTRDARHARHENWFTVGDVGYVDDEGYLYLTDRKNFMIISGGVNIYPQEVENVLTLHPKIADVAVIGAPDPEMGEQVKAVVQPAPGVTADSGLEREIIEFVRERIAHYKAPRSVDFVDSLPRTPTGKMRKAELKRRYS
jgi:fatty-acyl-CoA synthase